MADPTQPVKPGFFTTEFWITVLATLIITGITLANEILKLGLDVYETAATIVPAALYVLGRVGVKMFASISAKAVVDKIAAIVNENKTPTPPAP